MPIYTDVFGGANIYPSEISYSALALTANVTLSWPTETSTSNNLATRIMNISSATAGLSIYLPDASKTGTGQTILFNNTGAQTITVRNAGGTQVVTVAAGTLWQIYLTNNSTVNGTWSILQYGSTTSVANASALAGTGIVAVGALLSQSVPITQFNTDYTAGDPDRAKMYLWTGSGAGILTLPSAASVGNNWFMYLRNAGGGQVTVTPSGINTIDGLATKNYQPTESSIIVSDGTNFYTLGFGQASVFVFDYTVISVAGTGTYTLAGSELNRIVYKFTGALTGNKTVVVPATVQQYWIDNSTTGSYTLTVKTSAGTGLVVNQSSRGIYYCNGTDVVDADTATASYPITVAQGGTGATTAGAALINLGGTSVGTAVFTAADQAAAWAALGVAQAGVVNGGTF
jgi:phage tail protein X